MGTARATNSRVNIKQFNVQRYDPQLIVQEVANLARLSHECFPRILELFHTDTSVYMVTTYSDVFRLKNTVDLRNHTTSYTPSEVCKIFKSLVSAVQHCHEQHVILRSLLPENIMVMRYASEQFPRTAQKSTVVSDIEVQICDMGMAVHVTKADNVYQNHPLFAWTHLPYLSPEVAMKQQYSFSTDIWSLGVLLYMMLAGRLPFEVEDAMDRALLMQRIRDAEFSFLPEDHVWSGEKMDTVQGMLRGMLSSDPLNRMTLRELRRNPWN